jgi:hypothetical protein
MAELDTRERDRLRDSQFAYVDKQGGGRGPKDGRASAVATQSGPPTEDERPPEGQREGRAATDDTVREAGQDR